MKFNNLVVLSPTVVKADEMVTLKEEIGAKYRDLNNFLAVMTGSVLKAAVFHKKYCFCLSSTSAADILKADPDVPENFLKGHGLMDGAKLKKRVWTALVANLEGSGIFMRIERPAKGCATPFLIEKKEVAILMTQAYGWETTWLEVFKEQRESAVKFSQGEGRRKRKLSSNLAD